jgi:hypothetical protein
MGAEFGADGGSRRVGGVLLVGTGVLVGTAGATVGAIVGVRACRRYIATRAEPPRVTAHRRWLRARSATVAELGARRDYGGQAQPVGVSRASRGHRGPLLLDICIIPPQPLMLVVSVIPKLKFLSATAP